VTHWIEVLRPDVTTQTLILVKFLAPRELRELLPVTICPRPDRLVRVFAVFTVLTKTEMEKEGIVPRAVLKRQVDTVLDGGKVGGNEDGCFRVFELGGARVFADGEERREMLGGMTPGAEREMTPGLVMGDRGMAVWKGS
jgi:hypothetical protein